MKNLLFLLLLTFSSLFFFTTCTLLKEKNNPVLFLHEMPQILYNDSLFLRMPLEAEEETEFRKIAYKDQQVREASLPESEKERILNLINYVQDIIKSNIIKEEKE